MYVYRLRLYGGVFYRNANSAMEARKKLANDPSVRTYKDRHGKPIAKSILIKHMSARRMP